MKLRTTANIEKSSLISILNFCKRKNISISKSINIILQQTFLNLNPDINPIIFKTVKYQTKGLDFKLIHFSFDGKIYEACTDLRKFNKISVSLFLNEAIKIFFKNNIDEVDSIADVFLFKTNDLMDNYALEYCIIKNYNPKTKTFTNTTILRLFQSG